MGAFAISREVDDETILEPVKTFTVSKKVDKETILEQLRKTPRPTWADTLDGPLQITDDQIEQGLGWLLENDPMEFGILVKGGADEISTNRFLQVCHYGYVRWPCY